MPVSPQAEAAHSLVTSLQSRFVEGLEDVARRHDHPGSFFEVEWLRDEGRHGGGNRYTASSRGFFNRASVNVSQIHYDDLPEKKLGSATALSTIIHPENPHAPSVHMHISWTEMKDGSGYWRVMADLNPSVLHPEYRDRFTRCLEKAAPDVFEDASAQGDRYFFIPALGRHRGVVHFYLECFQSGDPDADRDLAHHVGDAVVGEYPRILEDAVRQYPEADAAARAEQLAYHTLYLFQVLTLDRGTTSGILVHDQNDLGIMGSLPAVVDRDLLASWKRHVVAPQDELVQGLVDALPAGSRVEIDDAAKLRLAQVVRRHYHEHPEALKQQASGDTIPPTVDNHR